MGEGDTPVVQSVRIGPQLGLKRLFFKLESLNPTGSYKDRFATVAVTLMRMRGQTRCIGTSSGNAGSAIAAYCARSQLAYEVTTVETAPIGKLQQMISYGATVLRVKGFGGNPKTSEITFNRLKERGERPDTALQITAFFFCPEGMAGVKTISYELAEADFDRPIDHVFSPSGGGGLTLAVARGFQDLVQGGRIAATPKVHCVQQDGCATIAGPLRKGLDRAEPVDVTTTVTGLQVGSVIDGHDLIPAVRKTGGSGQLISDNSTYQWQKRLLREEGIYCEPAGATALAGLESALKEGLVKSDETVVCLVTGSGFKDPAALDKLNSDRDLPILPLEEYLARE
jgi:threonine synthase